jgi:hypothetical protein
MHINIYGGDIMERIKKEFESRWNNGGFDERVMCDDGEWRILTSPHKIWAFFETKLKTERQNTILDYSKRTSTSYTKISWT